MRRVLPSRFHDDLRTASSFPARRRRRQIMQWHCTSCWSAVSDANDRCAHCGADPPASADAVSYAEKLLRAMEHPEPQTVRRAIWILGELGAPEAIPRLEAILDRDPDLYLTIAILDAAVRLGNAGYRIVERLTTHRSAIVREHAQRALIVEGAGW